MLVVTDIRDDPPVTGDLFAGKKFWIAHRCPARADFIKRVTYNGGHVVPLEKHADYLIVDHARKDLPAGGISYRFIEDSIRNAELQDPNDPRFRCGPPVGSVREPGAAQPPRPGRVPFTAQDDIELYEWVRSCEAKGAPILGNQIYQDLERTNHRHTWQSWRDRYVKHLRHHPPKTVSANPPPSPPSDPQPTRSSNHAQGAREHSTGTSEVRVSPKGKHRRVSPSPPSDGSPTYAPKSPPARKASEQPEHAGLTLQHFDVLLSQGDFIMDIPYGRLNEAWSSWSKHNPVFSANEWARNFESLVKPVYNDLRKSKTRVKVYDKAWEEWSKRHGEDGTLDEWLEYYRNNVVPTFPPPANDEAELEAQINEETTSPAIVGEGGNQEGGRRTDRTEIDEAESVAGEHAAEQTITTSITHEAQPDTVLGKRPHADEPSDQGNDMATPSPKRRSTDAKGSFASVQESIEVSPAKKSLESPARAAHDAISTTSSIPSPSLPVDAPSMRSQQHQSQPDITVYEERQDKNANEASEVRIRAALDGLDEDQMSGLLNTLRALPTAPEELDNTAPFDILVMHMMHFFSQIQDEHSQAVWEVGDKLTELGVMAKLFEDEEDDARSGDEQGEDHEYQLEVIQPDIADDEDQVEDLELDPSKHHIHHSSTPRDHHPRQHPSSSTTVSTPSRRKQQTRPASFSGGTAMTSFEMPSEPTYDLETEAEAEAYISSRVAPPYNFPEEHVLSALHATCANSTVTADAVLTWMRTNTASGSKRGRRSSMGLALLPDEPGVWTEEDDRSLYGGAQERRRVERKHGRARCMRRREFLAQL